MNELDPAGAILRSIRSPIVRRTYSVAGPNSLWHFDGNHRLIRYGMINGTFKLKTKERFSLVRFIEV